MMYTRANTLARQELDRQQNQVVGQPVVEAALEHADLGACHGSRGQPCLGGGKKLGKNSVVFQSATVRDCTSLN